MEINAYTWEATQLESQSHIFIFRVCVCVIVAPKWRAGMGSHSTLELACVLLPPILCTLYNTDVPPSALPSNSCSGQ